MKLSAPSLRTYVLVAMMLVGLVPLLVFWAVLSSDLNDQVLDDARRNANQRAHGLAERITGAIGGMESDLRALQTTPMVRSASGTREALEAELFRIQDAFEIFREITIYQTDGYIVATTDKKGAVPFLDKTASLQDAAAQEKPIVSPPKRRLGAEELYMDVYIPVLDEDQNVFRVIRANTSFESVRTILLGAKLGESGYFALTNDAGAVLVHKNPRHTLLSSLPEFEKSLKGSAVIDGRRFLTVSRELSAEETGAGQVWHLIGHVPEDEALALVSGTQGTLMWGLGLGLVGALAASLVLAQWLQGSLQPLVKASNAVARQCWDEIDVPPRGPSEFREVSTSFNQMVGEIQTHNSLLEQKIAEATARLQATFNSTREALLVVDMEGNVQSANRRFAEFFGYSEDELVAAGPECAELMLRDCVREPVGLKTFYEPLDVAIHGTGSEHHEAEWVMVQPRERVLKVYRVPVLGEHEEHLAHMWVFRDCSEARELEQRLQQAQKMQAVGRLAGGIAHDFNNLLTGIIGNLSLLALNVEPGTEAPSQLRSARTAAHRAADLVKQLLGFSRLSFLNLRHCSANDLIEEVVDLFSTGIDPTEVRVRARPSSYNWGLHADPTQINSVLMNLCVNAKDAIIEKGGGGEITLRSDGRLITTQEAVRLGGSKGGEYVVLTVRDSGAGIPPNVIERIFEPFFTTKDQGKGTGLGLATSYGIIEQHGGWMTCESRPGAGSTFRIFLPRDKSGTEASPLIHVHETKAVESGTETILLVDDDPIVRGPSETYLARCGYHILTADDGEEGLAVFEANRDRIAIVVLDLTMPKLSGADTFKRLRADIPDLPVIIYSGYIVDDEEFEAQNGSRPNAILCKPFELDDMANVIRDVLDASAKLCQLEPLELEIQAKAA